MEMSDLEEEDDRAGSCCVRRFLCFCCPPWPTKSIAKSVLKCPPASYSLVADGADQYHFIFFEKAISCFYQLWRQDIDSFFTTTARGNKIACMFFRPITNASYTILYSHGNCSDLGSELTFVLRLGLLVECNVFSYDYSGYGASSGVTSMKAIFADIECAWNTLKTRYGILEEKVVLFGRSLGTVPTVEAASRRNVAAVVLLSPLTSASRVVFQNTGRWCDRFPSMDKLSKVTAPILVFHGTNDRVIDFSHGLSVYKKCPNRVDPMWVEGAGHNDIQFHAEYLERLRRLTTVDLAANSSKDTLDAKIDQLKRMNLYI